MQRLRQLIFIVSILALSWFAMMATHELGHIVGAVVTGGTIERVVLYPLTISRTDVSPNPNPMVVVWLGPVLGCLIPVLIFGFTPRNWKVLRNLALFFSGFCLLANGAYIAFGSIDRVGDCGVMLQLGSPVWTLLLFGVVSIPMGLYCWHRLGSLKQFLRDPSLIDPNLVYSILTILGAVVALEFMLSPK